jgi:hypothetical protein
MVCVLLAKAGKSSVHNSHEAHHISDTKINRLIPLREKFVIYCGNRKKKIHPAARKQSFSMLKQVEHIVTTGLERFESSGYLFRNFI